jgi:RNA polymerase sigma-70 factor (ECF subfamily)
MLDPARAARIRDEVADGNRDAFREVVRAYGLTVRGYLASQVYNLDDVDDLAQEVFLVAFRALPTFRPGDDLGAWLRGIARNKLSEHWRRTGRRNRAMERFREEVAREFEGDLEAAAADDRPEVIEALLRCVARLPDRLRRVVRAGLDGYKPAALAEELATTVGAVYNLHYRANQLLRECVKKETA